MKCVWIILFSVGFSFTGFSQTKKPVYHPCFLMDSVAKNFTFIQSNIRRIFVDTFDCRQALLDSIVSEYSRTKDSKYLDGLSLIRQYPGIDVEGLYTDVIEHLLQKNFSGFLNQLYLSKNKYLSLEKELIGTMNMIVDGRPFKQKYMGMLNVELSKARDKKDVSYSYYLEKLKTKIEEDKY